MNAIELLKKDHRTVKSLFESFEKAKEKDEGTSKAELFASIKEELDVHARVEEEIFYPAFDGAAKEEDDKELVLEAGEEHKQVKTLLAELEELGPDDETFDAKMKVLKDNVEHHVEEEEGEMFPHAQKQLGSERLEELGQQIAARKEQILAQPAGRSAGRSASGSPASRTRAAAPGRRSGRKANGETSGTGVARARGSNPSERLESMGSDEESPRSGTPSRRSSRSSSSGRSRSSSSGRSRSSSSRGRSTGRSASGTRTSSSRTSSSRGGSSRGGARKTGARAASSRGGRSSSSGRSGSAKSSRGGSSSRRGSSRRRGSSSGSRGRGRSART